MRTDQFRPPIGSPYPSHPPHDLRRKDPTMTTYASLTRKIESLDRSIAKARVKLDALHAERKKIWRERENPKYSLGKPFPVVDHAC